MEEELRIEELDKVISQMFSGKSPGLDGLTIDFFKFL